MRAASDLDEGTSDLVAVTRFGFGKRMPVGLFRSQNRGGKGVIAIKFKREDDRLLALSPCTDDEELLLITQKGTIVRQRLPPNPSARDPPLQASHPPTCLGRIRRYGSSSRPSRRRTAPPRASSYNGSTPMTSSRPQSLCPRRMRTRPARPMPQRSKNRERLVQAAARSAAAASPRAMRAAARGRAGRDDW